MKHTIETERRNFVKLGVGTASLAVTGGGLNGAAAAAAPATAGAATAASAVPAAGPSLGMPLPRAEGPLKVAGL